MFVGRMDEILAIESHLFQTSHENPQDFLIKGERGIGKSSLLLFVSTLASGKVDPVRGGSYNFVTVSADLGGCTTQLGIIQKVGKGFREALGDHEVARERAKEFWEWLTNWEVLGVKYSKEDPNSDPDMIVREFVDGVVELCKRNPDLDGVLVLIDEADRPPTDANLGETLKMFSERLEKRDCFKVVFGLAGLPIVLDKVRASHDSSPRLFHTMTLEPLEMEERKAVVMRGLARATEKNPVPTSINEDALEYLADLSEGYPHFVQQFAYSAFEEDSDDNISADDVLVGTYKEGGALDQLGDKYFNDMYHARIGSDEYRMVLDAMAEHGDDWVSRKTILEESEASKTNVDNALKALKAREIIIQDDRVRGSYRLPTKSFAVWMKAIREERKSGLRQRNK